MRPVALLASLLLLATVAPAPVCAFEEQPASIAGESSSCPHSDEEAPCGPGCACLCCACQVPGQARAGQGVGTPPAPLIGHHLPGPDRLEPQEVHSRIYYPPRA